MTTAKTQTTPDARPFIKGAGGKGQLLGEIFERLPKEIKDSGRIDRYFEPFVGGGALFFRLSRRFKIRKAHLYDINPEIVAAYTAVRDQAPSLIRRLRRIEKEYRSLHDPRGREIFYYQKRVEYNQLIHGRGADGVRRAALIIFLNKTGYNGLFRMNSKGEYNVPFGRYANPTICDEPNLLATSRALRSTEIKKADFSECLKRAGDGSLVYFDPPYRPISKTANFTSYFKNGLAWGDAEQRRLKETCDKLWKKGAKVILSNSDPKNVDPTDHFFDELYAGDYRIERVDAARLINSDAARRGRIKEIVITNYAS